jgi:threonine dehydrogenase-like Zn-dependent dehydrogenase
MLPDLDEGRLKVARDIGATYTLKVTSKDSRALAKEIESTLGCQPHCSIECSGAEASIATAIYVSGFICVW